MLLVTVVTLFAILVGSVVLTVATFTSSSSNTNSLTAGDLTFDLTPAGAIVDTTALRPGATKSGQVQITNRHAAATFTLSFSGLGTGPLPGILQLTVAETAPVSKQLYNGLLSNVQPLALGKLAQSQTLQLNLTFSWPAASQSPDLQAQNVPLILQWSATT